jgi:hypothetical protein
MLLWVRQLTILLLLAAGVAAGLFLTLAAVAAALVVCNTRQGLLSLFKIIPLQLVAAAAKVPAALTLPCFPPLQRAVAEVQESQMCQQVQAALVAAAVAIQATMLARLEHQGKEMLVVMLQMEKVLAAVAVRVPLAQMVLLEVIMALLVVMALPTQYPALQ